MGASAAFGVPLGLYFKGEIPDLNSNKYIQLTDKVVVISHLDMFCVCVREGKGKKALYKVVAATIDKNLADNAKHYWINNIQWEHDRDKTLLQTYD